MYSNRTATPGGCNAQRETCPLFDVSALFGGPTLGELCNDVLSMLVHLDTHPDAHCAQNTSDTIPITENYQRHITQRWMMREERITLSGRIVGQDSCSLQKETAARSATGSICTRRKYSSQRELLHNNLAMTPRPTPRQACEISQPSRNFC